MTEVSSQAIMLLFSREPVAFVDVPYDGRRIPFVFAGTGFKYLAAVEADSVDWSVAVDLAVRNQGFAHHSYVALGRAAVITGGRSLQERFEGCGVGLISVVDTEATIEIPSLQNRGFDLHRYRNVKALLKEHVHPYPVTYVRSLGHENVVRFLR